MLPPHPLALIMTVSQNYVTFQHQTLGLNADPTFPAPQLVPFFFVPATMSAEYIVIFPPSPIATCLFLNDNAFIQDF